MVGLRFALSRLSDPRVWERVFRERLSEPLHLNLISLAVAAFGSFRAKVYFDLIVRQHHAYGLLSAADQARSLGLSAVTVLEFGVANGAGLLNMCEIARKVSALTAVDIRVVGFDGGQGMPAPVDYRDHPEFYSTGWFPMESRERLEQQLPPNAKLVVGDIEKTVRVFAEHLDPAAPVGFVSVDVDYHSSATAALRVFDGDARCYLPMTSVYLDDVAFPGHSEWAGEMLAVREFSDARPRRKIGRANFLRENRLFKRASWVSHMYALHVLDHPSRAVRSAETSAPVVLLNPYRVRA